MKQSMIYYCKLKGRNYMFCKEHSSKLVLIYSKIIPASAVRKVWRPVRRISIFILRINNCSFKLSDEFYSIEQFYCRLTTRMQKEDLFSPTLFVMLVNLTLSPSSMLLPSLVTIS